MFSATWLSAKELKNSGKLCLERFYDIICISFIPKTSKAYLCGTSSLKCDTITQTEMNFVMHCRNHDLLWYFLLELLGKIWHWNLFPGKPPTDSSSLASKLSKGGEEAVSQSSADYNRHLSALNNSVSQWINVCWTSWIATGLLGVHPNSHILLMLDRTMYLRTRCVIWLQYFLITKNTWQKSMISSVSRTKKIRKASSL